MGLLLERAYNLEPEKHDPDVKGKGYEEGLADGREQGGIEGRREQNIEIARGMKLEKLDLALIAKITGLPPSEIESLD